MSNRADVAVLIVNWNTRELVLRCLETLAAEIDDRLACEVIVVDNGSVDGSADALAEQAGIDLIRNADNLGFAAAVNQAYRRSDAPLVLLLNSDVELTLGALETLVGFLQERPDVAGAAPVYRNPDGSLQPFHFRFPTFAMTMVNGSGPLRGLPGAERLLREYKMLDEDFSEPRRVPQPSASCLLLRRSCLPADRILDERYPIYFNDVQLARSLSKAGHELWVTPDAVVVHEAHASGKLLDAASYRRLYVGSVIRMLDETESPLKVWTYRLVVFLQSLALMVARKPGALGPRELWRTLGGDPGPLPARPAT